MKTSKTPSRCICVHPWSKKTLPPSQRAPDVERPSSATRPPGRWANLRLMAKPKRKSRVRCSALFGIKKFITQESRVARSQQKRSDDRSLCRDANGSNLPTNDAKHTKINPRPRSRDTPLPNSTGGNRENRGSSPSPFPPLAPVQLPPRCSPPNSNIGTNLACDDKV